MAITLRSSDLEVVVTPERGADIVQVVDLRTGTPVLAVSPTGRQSSTMSVADSMAQWLHAYPGGWQLLAPNAGPERTHDGVRQGFHGEAGLARWSVLTADEGSCELETFLASAPLRLHRVVTVEGTALVVTDTVENLSRDPVSTRLVQHPAFGAPFLDADSYVLVPAGALITDAEAPGSLAGADLVDAPATLLAEGPVPGSIALPGPGARESLFAAFSDVGSAPHATFCSPNSGFAMRLEWDGAVFPHAWFWIEANAGSGWPWFRRLYAIAVEPANVLPGDGETAGRQRGGDGVRLEPGEHITTTTRLSRQPLPDAR
ncbi:DUF4432 family protein [Microbacterium deminutum]|uniref:DUF4432 domain-containing protein n=1 Tax=Microbacterium deminutum TaxID=344164 RepID=A0ABP5CI10_9MICO